MTTTATTDPWAVRDHDPTSITEPMTGTGDIDTTTKALAFARADVHAAAAADDPHQRRRHANSALAYATTVLTATDATDTQRRYAGYYQHDALAMIAEA
jgi:hypothetical protein